jgi:thiamine-monophosphate kinase
MAGMPQFVLLSIAVAGEQDRIWTDSYMAGFFSMLEEYNCVLIGGDTVSSDKLTLSITVIGTAPAGKALRRSGAQVGDSIYVSGPLGSAAAGLHLCQSGQLSQADTSNCKWQELIGSDLEPTPAEQGH